jgi:hypothetical protein
MTAILSSISGQFSKALFLGAFFPSVVFVILGMIFALPLFPAEFGLLKPLEALGVEWKVVFLIFLTLVISGLLYNLNISIIRLYEGYPWKDSWIGSYFLPRQRTRFKAAQARHAGLPDVISYLEARAGADAEDVQTVEDMRPRVGQQVNYAFPDEEALVLPTRLGNTIRSFEVYPARQYGMSSIALWPRLVAKVDKDYAAAIDEAKTSFDFMINSSVLSAALASVILTTGLSNPSSLGSTADWLRWALEVVVFLAFAYLLYRGSIGRASAWGSMVKGAFDLYRWDLLKQLGYQHVPKTVPQERSLWGNISRRTIYGDPPKEKGRLPDYAAAEAYARGTPAGVRLKVGRGLAEPDAKGKVVVTVRVENPDKHRPVTTLVVTDTTAKEAAYLWNSARVDGQVVPVSGTNPYHFHLGERSIPPLGELLLTYIAVPRKG